MVTVVDFLITHLSMIKVCILSIVHDTFISKTYLHCDQRQEKG